MLSLDNVDVRTLSNSMRAALGDERTQQLVPLGNSNSLLITAPASMATNIVEMFERAGAESAKALKASQPQKPAEPPAPAK